MVATKKRFITDYDEYMRRARESEGFDVPPMKSGRLCGGIHPFKNIKSDDMKRAVEIAKFAVKDHNSKTGSDLVFDKLIKANGQPCAGYLFYLTFRVRSPSLQRPMLYQAKVWDTITKQMIIQIFREQPPHESEANSPSIPKGSFSRFLNDLRKLPELPKLRYCHVTSLASKAWRSMSDEEKEKYCRTGHVNYKDIAGFMAASE